MLPAALIGETHLGGLVCERWELRITARCLVEDLGQDADAPFDVVAGHDIVKAFVKDRFDHTEGTRQVAPLTSGRTVWVLGRGHDNRGGTWYDKANHVVWLVSYGYHRSEDPDDFFPYTKRLDGDKRLFPTEADYRRLLLDRDVRFSAAVRIEGPLLVRTARDEPGEHRIMLGGTYGACIAVEVAGDVAATTVAFRVGTVPWDYVPVILAALHPDAEGWSDAAQMPGRPLDDDEVAFTHLYDA